MKDARIETERSIFFKALEIDSETARDEYLTTACAGDPMLRADVEALLHAHEEPQELLDTPIVRGTDAVSPHFEAPGEAVGPYRLVRQIGEGSFGIVFLAEQEQPVRRQVALKIIKPGMDTKEVIARFETEKQALAMMDHPNIARVFDAGITESGRPYVAMELAQGTPITEYCRHNELTLRDRLTLLIDVCRAIQHAHQKGIIHRDIKPNNILVTNRDGKPMPKVIDFGIAKALDHSAADQTRLTTLNQIVGTPLYMSPEQTRRGNLDIDTRTDVYSLGVLLYELLTGTTPHEEERLKDIELEEIQRIICEEEPPRPSKRIAMSQERGSKSSKRTALTAPIGTVSADLDWIVMKALEKDPARRYESAAALASDVERYLLGQAVEAHPPSAAYRAKKFVRRYRVPVSVAAAILLFLIIGGVSTGVANWKLVQKNAQQRWSLYLADMALAQDHWERGRLDQLETLLRKYIPNEGEEDIRDFEWYYLWRQWKCNNTADGLPLPHDGDWKWQDSSADGSRLAVVGGRKVVVFDMNTRKQLASFRAGEARWKGVGLSISPDGGYVVYRGKKSMVLANVDTGEERPIEGSRGDGTATFSPDSRTLAVAVGPAIWLWDIDSGTKTGDLAGHSGDVLAMRFSPDGKQLASAGMDATVRVWNLSDLQAKWAGKAGATLILSVAWSPDGKLLATGRSDKMVVVWDAEGGELERPLGGARDHVRVVAFSPDGKLLAAGCREGVVRMWSLPDFAEHEPISGFDGLFSLSFLPDGRLVFPRNGDLVIRKVESTRSDSFPVVTPPDLLPERASPSPAFSTDGNILVATGPGFPRRVYFWQVTRGRGKAAKPLELDFDPVMLAVSSQDLLAVTDARSPTAHLFDLKTRQSKGQLVLSRHVLFSCLAFSASGNRLAVGGYNGSVLVWDLKSHEVIMDNSAYKSWVRDLYFCHDENRLLTVSMDGSVREWDVESARLLHTAAEPGDSKALGVVAASDWSVFAAGYYDGVIRLFDPKSYTEVETLRGHKYAVRGLRIINHGTTLISIGGERTVRIWNLATCEERLAIDHRIGICETLAVSPDEGTIAVGMRDGSIRLISAASPEEVQAEPGWR